MNPRMVLPLTVSGCQSCKDRGISKNIRLVKASDCLWFIKEYQSARSAPSKERWRTELASCLDCTRISEMSGLGLAQGMQRLCWEKLLICAFYPGNLGSSTHRYKLIQTHLPFWLRHDMARHGTTWHDDKNKQQLRNDMQSRQSYTELHFLTTQKFERHKDATDQTEEI